MPSSRGFLGVTFKPKDKEDTCINAILLFYVLQKYNYKNFAHFSKSIIVHRFFNT
jgi:hypothetical protein